jgi:hypothetical protein
MTDQQTVLHVLIGKMKSDQPAILKSIPEEAQVRVEVIPHLGLPFPYLKYKNLIYCPFKPLKSS